jgi:hypothetical protein
MIVNHAIMTNALARFVDPTFHEILPRKFNSRAAIVMLLAIAAQESRLHYRKQLGNGPARGLWQFERGSAKHGGGVYGVVRHAASERYLRAACAIRGVEFDAPTIYNALADDDLLACAVARLLLYTDAFALPSPSLGAAQSAWLYYIRTWNPGKPHRATWDAFHRMAVEVTS